MPTKVGDTDNQTKSKKMEAYIFDAIRTPRGNGKAGKSSLKDIKPVQLLSQLYAALEQRTGLSNTEIEAVILGCVGQVGGQGANIAKVSTLYHGWEHHIEGITMNTFCSSALSAIGLANAKVSSGMNDLVIAGGIEMLSIVPMFADKGAWFADKEVVEKSHFTHMGVSADLIATIEDQRRTGCICRSISSKSGLCDSKWLFLEIFSACR